MNLDSNLKNEIAKVFWAQGYFAETEVKLLRPDQALARRGRVELTDIDVLGVSLRSDFTERLVLADCKFGGGTKDVRSSAISRTFWLCGVMKFYGADEGIAVLKKSIESDHKHVSRRLGVTLLEASQVGDLKRRMSVADAVETAPQFSESWQIARASLDNGWKSADFLLFRDFRYWLLAPAKGTKDLIGALIEAANRLPKKRPCASWFCDVITLLSLSLARLAVEMKHSDLSLSNKKEMEGALLSALYGGQDNYHFRVSVLTEFRRQLTVLKDNFHVNIPVPEVSEQLIRLPAWDEFIELFARILNAYSTAIHIPRLCRTLHAAFLTEKSISSDVAAEICGLTSEQFVRVLDLQQRLMSYVIKVAKLGSDFVGANGLDFLMSGAFNQPPSKTAPAKAIERSVIPAEQVGVRPTATEQAPLNTPPTFPVSVPKESDLFNPSSGSIAPSPPTESDQRDRRKD